MYENLRVISLSALGNVFIAHPKLLLKETSIILMNQIFVDEMGVSLKVELLKIFVDFLQNETKKMSLEAVAKDGKKEKKKIDIKVLVGNAEEMGDSGVSSSLMQFYLDYILGCLLNGADSILGSVAFEVLILVLEQGLVHPMMVRNGCWA